MKKQFIGNVGRINTKSQNDAKQKVEIEIKLTRYMQ